jgi:hypothetical protein
MIQTGSFGFTAESRALAATAAAAREAAAAAQPLKSMSHLPLKRNRVHFASTMAGARELVLLLWGLAWLGGGREVRCDDHCI